MFGDDGYYFYPATPFWDGVSYNHIQKGTHCLWKNVPRGKNGGESTKVELFHGEAIKRHRKVHYTYLVGDPEISRMSEYCVVGGGRCVMLCQSRSKQLLL